MYEKLTIDFLKTGMVIKTRKGFGKILKDTEKGDVIGAMGRDQGHTWGPLDLGFLLLIDEVYEMSPENVHAASINNRGELIWKREEIKEMTLKDVQDLLGFKVKIIEQKDL